MVTQGFCYSEQELSCNLIKLAKAASSFPRQPSSLPSTWRGGGNPVLVTPSKEGAKEMLPNIPQSQESRDLPGRENRGALHSVLWGQAWANGMPTSRSPLSKHSPLTAVPPAPLPLQMQRLRAGYVKEKGFGVMVRLESEPSGQKDTILPITPLPAFLPSPRFPQVERETCRQQVPDEISIKLGREHVGFNLIPWLIIGCLFKK